MDEKETQPSPLRKQLFIAVLIILVAGVLGELGARRLPFFTVMENWGLDFRATSFQDKSRQVVRDDIVILGINEDTLDTLRYRSPVDRGFLNDLLNHLARQNVRAVVLDLLFDRPTEAEKDTAFQNTLRNFPVPLFVSFGDVSDIVTEKNMKYMDTYLQGVGKGYANMIITDDDGVVRGIPIRDDAWKNKDMLGLAAAVADALGVELKTDSINLEYALGPDDKTPAFKIFPAHIAPRMPKNFLNLEGKIIFIGATLREVDTYKTPFTANLGAFGSAFTKEEPGKTVKTFNVGEMPGVIIHAHALAQLLDGRQLNVASTAVRVVITLTLALAAFLIARMSFPLWAIMSASAVVVLGYIIVTPLVYQEAGYLLPIVAPVLGYFFSAALTNLYQQRRYHGERAFIRGALSRYVAEDVVQQLERQPWRLKLGGERRNLTFLFTDIEGFTTLSERTEPEVLVPALNSYLDQASRVVLEHDGVIDKFIGDAIVAVFGAFHEDENHSQKAVECALALDKFAQDFAAKMKGEGLAFGRTRIGVNTGTAIIGNFGGDVRFDYTSIGDAVNTAARLEGANKYFGTHICISGSAAENCENIDMRPVGEIVLKGKTDGTPVFEPMYPQHSNFNYLDEYKAAYTLMKEKSDTASERFEELAERAPADTLVKLHLNRLKNGQTGPRIELDEK